MTSLLPTLAALAASILLGTMPFQSLLLFAKGFDTQSMLFWRYWIALAVMVPAAVLGRQDLVGAWRNGGWILFANAAAIGSTQTFFYFQALKSIPSSVAIVIFYAYPALTLVVERVVLKAPVSPLAAASTVLVLAGAAMTVGRVDGLDRLPVEGLVLAACSPILYTGYLFVAARQLKRLPAIAGASMVYGGLGLGYVLVVAASGLVVPSEALTWAHLVTLAVIGGAIPMALFAFSIPRLGPSGYGVVASSELVTAVLIGVILLGESFNRFQALGTLCVVAGILIYRKPQPPAQATVRGTRPSIG